MVDGVKELTDLDIQEVSVVDEPANLRKFFFVKRDGETIELNKGEHISIDISSNGTVGTTELKVNDKVIKNIIDFQFSIPGFGFDTDNPDDSPVFFQFAAKEKDKDGLTTVKIVSLAKSNEMIEKSDGTKAEGNFEGELEILNDYMGFFPPEVKTAINAVINKRSSEKEVEKGETTMAEEEIKTKENKEVVVESKEESKQEIKEVVVPIDYEKLAATIVEAIASSKKEEQKAADTKDEEPDEEEDISEEELQELVTASVVAAVNENTEE